MIKKFKLIILLAGLTLGSNSLFSEETPSKKTEVVRDSFGYVDIGIGPLPLLVPSFAVGYRTQKDHHGADISTYVSTVVALTQFKTSALYLYYFKPDLCSQFYIGGGLGVSTFWNKRFQPAFHRHANPYISPELAFGKQYRNESGDTRFFQTQISWPTIPCGSHRPFFMPLVVFSYGIGF